MCWQDLYYTALFLRRATFTNISAFTFKLYPNSKMGRGLQLVTAEAFGAKWCLATSHLESPMWSECVLPSQLAVMAISYQAASRCNVMRLGEGWRCRHHYMFHREREIQVKQVRGTSTADALNARRARK